MVQRAVKTWVDHRNRAATLIQNNAKRFLLRRRKERLQHGIIKFQVKLSCKYVLTCLVVYQIFQHFFRSVFQVTQPHWSLLRSVGDCSTPCSMHFTLSAPLCFIHQQKGPVLVVLIPENWQQDCADKVLRYIHGEKESTPSLNSVIYQGLNNIWSSLTSIDKQITSGDNKKRNRFQYVVIFCPKSKATFRNRVRKKIIFLRP